MDADEINRESKFLMVLGLVLQGVGLFGMTVACVFGAVAVQAATNWMYTITFPLLIPLGIGLVFFVCGTVVRAVGSIWYIMAFGPPEVVGRPSRARDEPAPDKKLKPTRDERVPQSVKVVYCPGCEAPCNAIDRKCPSCGWQLP